MGPTRGTQTKLFVKFTSVVGVANTSISAFNNVSEVDTRCGPKGSGQMDMAQVEIFQKAVMKIRSKSQRCETTTRELQELRNMQHI